MFFEGGSICSLNRPILSHRTDINFPIKFFFSPRTHTNFPGASIFSSNRYSFSRTPYLVLEHLRFSRRLYLVLEHIQFSRSPLCLEHIDIFQEGTPSRTDISLIGLGGCFRYFIKTNKYKPSMERKIITLVQKIQLKIVVIFFRFSTVAARRRERKV